jgi:hypothetical protein
MVTIASASAEDLATLVANFQKMTAEGRQAYLLVGAELAAMNAPAARAPRDQQTRAS